MSRPAEDDTPRYEFGDLVYIGEPNFRPNRAQRRARGIRTPLKVIDAYREMLQSRLPDPGEGESGG